MSCRNKYSQSYTVMTISNTNSVSITVREHTTNIELYVMSNGILAEIILGYYVDYL